MGRRFFGAQYLEIASATVNGWAWACPFTITARVYNSARTGGPTTLGVYSSTGGASNHSHRATVGTGTVSTRVFSSDGGGGVNAAVSGGVPLRRSVVVGGVWASATSRVAWHDGVAGAVNATSRNPVALDRVTVGAMFFTSTAARSEFFTGDLEDIALWSVALTDGENQAVARGVNPYLIRRASLVGLWCTDAMGDSMASMMGGTNSTFTNNGSTYVPGSRVLRAYEPRVIAVGLWASGVVQSATLGAVAGVATATVTAGATRRATLASVTGAANTTVTLTKTGGALTLAAVTGTSTATVTAGAKRRVTLASVTGAATATATATSGATRLLTLAAATGSATATVSAARVRALAVSTSAGATTVTVTRGALRGLVLTVPGSATSVVTMGRYLNRAYLTPSPAIGIAATSALLASLGITSATVYTGRYAPEHAAALDALALLPTFAAEHDSALQGVSDAGR